MRYRERAKRDNRTQGERRPGFRNAKTRTALQGWGLVVAGGVIVACQAARSASEVTGSTAPPASSTSESASSPSSVGAPSPSHAKVTPLELVNYTFESQELGTIPVVVRVPPHAPGAQLPVLIALHGRGEAQKGPQRGARGFIDDYGLEVVWAWLAAERGSRVAPAGLPATYRQAVETELDRTPFTGMVVVMPYLPDRFRGPEAFDNATDYARVLRQVVTRVKAEQPVRQEPGAWALDGISLGGRVAMACAPVLSSEIGAFGSVQAAIDERELSLFADLLSAARTRNPSLRFSLATSDQDYFRLVLEHYHASLSAKNLKHEWSVLPGDHSYAFNRGPGVTHLLLSYDRWFHP